MSSFLPSPLVGEGGASRSEATGEWFLHFDELCQNVLQNAGWSLQHLIVPVARDSETFGFQDRFSLDVTLRRSVLATIDFDDDTFSEANEIGNKCLKWHLSPKFEERKSSVPKQPPHRRFSIGGLVAHFLCKIADALGGRSMAWRLRHEPLTRRLRRHPLPQGERENHTRIGIST
jgi:hypothetical protein